MSAPAAASFSSFSSAARPRFFSSFFPSFSPARRHFFSSPLRGEGDAQASGEGENRGGFCCGWGIDVGIPPRFLNVILNLFQDLIILFIRLSLFVKCMRCRNEFGMTIRCVWATKTSSPSPLRGEGYAESQPAANPIRSQ